SPGNEDRSDRLLVADHRHPEATAEASDQSSIFSCILRITQYVCNETNPTSSDRARRDRLIGAPHRPGPPSSFDPSRRQTMDRRQTDKFAVNNRNGAHLRIAQFFSSLANSFKHRLNVSR